MRTQIIDKPCKKCGAQPAEYEDYTGNGNYRGTCIPCRRKILAASREVRPSIQSRKHLPLEATLDRACRVCEKSPALYKRHLDRVDGYRSDCVECQSDHAKQWRENLPPEKDASNRRRINEWGKQDNAQLRIEVFNYIGRVCECCNESNLAFLTVDHVNSDGAQQRRETGIGSGVNLYRWLRSNGYPKEGFRTLCWNCNCARHYRADGICPHETERQALLAA